MEPIQAQYDGKYGELVRRLAFTWHQTIPLSQFMQLAPVSFDGEEFVVGAPMGPNLNLHQTMFAGSIYTLMTLTGWGMVWLQQELAEIEGDIVLADANIRYLAPVTQQPVAKVTWPSESEAGLKQGQKSKVELEVSLFSADVLCAKFIGKYVSLPKRG